MNNYKLKLKALLHDPVHKIWVLKNSQSITPTNYCSKNHQFHEKVAEDLFSYLFTECPHEEKVKKADHIASALSRIIVAPQNIPNKEEFEQESAVGPNDKPKFIDLFSLKTENIEYPQNHDEVEEFFKKLGNLNFSSPDEKARLLFLFLWRFIPEIFPWINKHPADTRAPNHSIYDHLVQTSAVVSAIENEKIPAFLLFTISPVQEFISKARKTSDLWSGSYMLSYLTYKCIKVIMEELGPDNVIFPNLLGQPLVDKWLYHKFKNSPILNLNEPIFQNFQNWLKKWQYYEEDKCEEIEKKLTIANFPNRFLAIIPYDGDNCLAKKIEEKLKDCFLDELSKKVSEKIKKEIQSNIKDQIKNHLLNYFQCYWVVLPWTTDQIYNPSDALEDYRKLISDQNELYKTVEIIIYHPYYRQPNVGSAYSLLLELTEKLLGARKSLRNVLGENYYESEGEKCHLCGEFEVLKFDNDKRRNDEKWENLRKNNPGLLKESEKLCGVCMTKRLFPEIIKEKLGLSSVIKFPSTYEMASIGEKRRLNSDIKKQFKNHFDNFIQTIKNKNNNRGLPPTISVPRLKDDPLYEIDGQYLMKETYRVEYFEKEYGIKIDEQDFKNIVDFLEKEGISPSKYYAILQMDGDNMGKWLKGEFNPKIKETIHSKTKDALIKYSQGDDKKEIIELLCYKHPNSPSIHQAFSRKLSQFAVEEVRRIVEDESYGKLVYAGGDDILALLPIDEVLKCAKNLQAKFKEILSPKASMSAGIVIVHCKYPLYLALNEVRNAEKIAKRTFGKNAFCIRVISHSGEIRDSGGKWELIDFLNDLICKFKSEIIPSGFPSEFAEIYEKEKIEDKEILKLELKRIYLRKETKDKKFIEKILENIEKYKWDIKYFVNLLLISRFIAKEVRIW